MIITKNAKNEHLSIFNTSKTVLVESTTKTYGYYNTVIFQVKYFNSYFIECRKIQGLSQESRVDRGLATYLSAYMAYIRKVLHPPLCEGSMRSPARQHRSKTQKASRVASRSEPIAWWRNHVPSLQTDQKHKTRCVVNAGDAGVANSFLPQHSSLCLTAQHAARVISGELRPNMQYAVHDTDSSGVVHLSHLSIVNTLNTRC
jgi:hypothetical protein